MPRDKFSWVLDYVRRHGEQAGIVYCATRKAVDQTCQKLVQHGVSATRYHAGLDDDERRRNQEDFVYDRRRVMVATNAFGMGIDKSNISFVLHYNMPKNIESYYQEAGRAGRDGSAAQCVLLFSAGDVQTAKYLINAPSENEALSEAERQEIRRQDMERLRQMTGYCKTSGCYRRFLLNYFGEHSMESCGSCGNCTAQTRRTDITVQAQKILSGVARVERRFPGSLGTTLIVRMLHGSKEQRVMQLGLDDFSTYGIMRDTDRMKIREYIDVLVEQGYLVQTSGSFPVLQTTDRAWEALRGKATVAYAMREERAEPTARRRTAERRATAPEDSLFEALRGLRTELARAEGVPAYVVFSNATLADMAAKRPADMVDFMDVSGVGEYKAARYGRAFLEVIRNWESKKYSVGDD
jgi:ATP-dependent DNA helicase RecQ